MATPTEWREPCLTSGERAQRRQLRKCINLGQRFERLAATAVDQSDTADERAVRAITHGHIVQAIHLCRGVLRLHESPAVFNLIRTLCELHINLHYIICAPDMAAQRARNFHDYFEVNKVRILREIRVRIEHAKELLDDAALLAQLEAHKPRFQHGRRWDWDSLNVIDRLGVVADAARREEEAKGEAKPADRHTAVAALYTEAHPHVHGGMFSIAQLLDDERRPRMRLVTAGRLLTLLAGHALLDMAHVSQEVLGVTGMSGEIASLAAESIAVADDLTAKGRV